MRVRDETKPRKTRIALWARVPGNLVAQARAFYLAAGVVANPAGAKFGLYPECSNKHPVSGAVKCVFFVGRMRVIERVWKPNVTVAAVIERDGRFLMVEEETAAGLRFNQPAGHLEDGESLVAAAARETLEETAHRFVPEYLVGMYQWPLPQSDVTYLRFAFAGTVSGAVDGLKLDDGIVRAVWLTVTELRESVGRHRSPLVMQCVEDWIEGRRFPLDLIRHYGA